MRRDRCGVDDWVELYNRGTGAMDISGTYLSDNRSNNLKFVIPGGTVLAPGEFVVFDELTLGFSFSSTGEVIMYTAADGVSGLDFYDYGEQTADVSEGRSPDGSSRWYQLITPTPGATNSGASAVEDQVPGTIAALSNLQIAPNPFNPRTEIRFVLGQTADVEVTIYGLNGRLVQVLHRGSLAKGHHTLAWDGGDDHGRRSASGTYFARIVTDDTSMKQKILLLK